MIRHTQFDTIYHEHFSYLSLLAVSKAFAEHGLAIFDVEELSTHGGSLRVFGKHAADDFNPICESVDRIRSSETEAGLSDPNTYSRFAGKIEEVKCDLLSFLIDCKRKGKSVAGYGAPAKGNTLLNYCGVGPELLPYTVDRSPHKQGTYLPGSRIPVEGPDQIARTKPDYLLILPWNLQTEISQQMNHIREWGGQFVVPIPSITIF
ncbi:MAG: methyltransferase C-terminal domain-containing protein, partial [Bryobacteraceae bacterium]